MIAELDLTQEEAGRRLGLERSTIANLLRLLELSDELQQMVSRGTLTAGHARAVLAVEDEGARLRLARLIATRALSVRDAERLAARETGRRARPASTTLPEHGRPRRGPSPQAFGTRVEIKERARGGRIVIHFRNHDDFERLYESLTGHGTLDYPEEHACLNGSGYQRRRKSRPGRSLCARTLDLTGLWRFEPDAYDEGERRGFYAPEHDCARWREVRVPCCLDDCGPGMAPTRAPDGSDARSMSRPLARPAGGPRFEGVNYHARVWVNGQPAGASEDGFLPFELPMDGLVRAGRAERRSGPGGQRPAQGRGARHGTRLASLRRHPAPGLAGRHGPPAIAHLAVTAEPAPGGGTVAVRAQLANGEREPAEAALMVEVHG